MPTTFSEDASGAEKWAENYHTFFLNTLYYFEYQEMLFFSTRYETIYWLHSFQASQNLKHTQGCLYKYVSDFKMCGEQFIIQCNANT